MAARKKDGTLPSNVSASVAMDGGEVVKKTPGTLTSQAAVKTGEKTEGADKSPVHAKSFSSQTVPTQSGNVAASISPPSSSTISSRCVERERALSISVMI